MYISTMKEFNETMEKIDAAEFWDDFDGVVYNALCEFAGLDYDSYEDPDTMWNDLTEFAETHKA